MIFLLFLYYLIVPHTGRFVNRVKGRGADAFHAVPEKNIEGRSGNCRQQASRECPVRRPAPFICSYVKFGAIIKSGSCFTITVLDYVD